MDIFMGVRGERFVAFLKMKRRQKRGKKDKYTDKAMAAETKIPYDTLVRWLGSDSVERIDMENLLLVYKAYGDEFMIFMASDAPLETSEEE